jgi:hypothetical protein
MEEIVAEWQAFSRTLLPAAATMRSLALRDHEIQFDDAGAEPRSSGKTPPRRTVRCGI